MNASIFQTLAKHRTAPPALQSQIAGWEQRNGVVMPESIKAIYRFSNGLSMGPAGDPTFLLHPIEEVETISMAIFAEPPGEYGPPSMFGLIRLHDGDYAALDLAARSESDPYRIVDAFTETIHITWRNPKVIAYNIEEFFIQADRHLTEPCAYWWLNG